MIFFRNNTGFSGTIPGSRIFDRHGLWFAAPRS